MSILSKMTIAVITSVLLAVLLVGCGTADDGGEKDVGSNGPHITASFYPIYDLASKVMGDEGTVDVLIPNGAEPHGWEPSATDMRELAATDLLIMNGAGMEPWSADLLARLGDDAPKAVVTSEGLELLTPDAYTLTPEHHHDGDVHTHEHDHEVDEHAHEHDADDHDGHDHGDIDPHVWLSPMNAKHQMRVITDALIEQYPDHAGQFETNYTKHAGELDQLDSDYKAALHDLHDARIFVAHEAYGYLARDYGFKQTGITGISADEEPDAKRMAAIVDAVKDSGAKVIFTETLIDSKTADTISRETGAEVKTLSPVASRTEEEVSAGADYVSIMRKNLKTLTKALEH